MLNHPPVDPNNLLLNSYPLELTLSHKYQQLDPPLLEAVKEDKRFSSMNVYGNQLIMYQPYRSERQCTMIPQKLQYPAVRWCHSLLGHAGVTRLTNTLKDHFWFPQMKEMIERVIRKCPLRQRHKTLHKHYGHLPPKNLQELHP